MNDYTGYAEKPLYPEKKCEFRDMEETHDKWAEFATQMAAEYFKKKGDNNSPIIRREKC